MHTPLAFVTFSPTKIFDTLCTDGILTLATNSNKPTETLHSRGVVSQRREVFFVSDENSDTRGEKEKGREKAYSIDEGFASYESYLGYIITTQPQFCYNLN